MFQQADRISFGYVNYVPKFTAKPFGVRNFERMTHIGAIKNTTVPMVTGLTQMDSKKKEQLEKKMDPEKQSPVVTGVQNSKTKRRVITAGPIEGQNSELLDIPLRRYTAPDWVA